MLGPASELSSLILSGNSGWENCEYGRLQLAGHESIGLSTKLEIILLSHFISSLFSNPEIQWQVPGVFNLLDFFANSVPEATAIPYTSLIFLCLAW